MHPERKAWQSKIGDLEVRGEAEELPVIELDRILGGIQDQTRIDQGLPGLPARDRSTDHIGAIACRNIRKYDRRAMKKKTQGRVFMLAQRAMRCHGLSSVSVPGSGQ